MHVFMGWLGPMYFTYTPGGIGMAILVVCITQGVDQIRIKKESYAAINELPASEQATATKELDATIKSILIKTYIQNVVLCTAIVLIVADFARTHIW